MGKDADLLGETFSLRDAEALHEYDEDPEAVLELFNSLVLTYWGTQLLLSGLTPAQMSRKLQENPAVAKWPAAWAAGNLLFQLSGGPRRTGLLLLYWVGAPLRLVHYALGELVGLGSGPAKFFTAGATFVGFTYVQARKRSPLLSARQFGRHMGLALCETALAFPFLMVFIAFLLLVLETALEYMNPFMSLGWLNPVIFYGCFYGPFSSAYFFCLKRVGGRSRRGGVILPV